MTGVITKSDHDALFLHEIGELDLSLQAQVLRVFQERTSKRIGGNVWQQADFRLICATNRDLEQELREGRFRADLHYRVSDRKLRVPSLRERREDIRALIAHFWRSPGSPAEQPEFDTAPRDFPIARGATLREIGRATSTAAIRVVLGRGGATFAAPRLGSASAGFRDHDANAARLWPGRHVMRGPGQGDRLRGERQRAQHPRTDGGQPPHPAAAGSPG